ncbi:IclR family transcriptional regulator [Microbacterium lushaniae]|nr:IclR family transcriptional regulator [Microbacterium lushaniae]KAA9157697.1 IclR family transcriptional regulator [Microbacterium lushaniae]
MGSRPDERGALGRMLQVLECFDEDEPALTVAEMSRRTGIPLSSLHRWVAVLAREGLLARGPGATYAIGSRLWELGELSPLSLRLRETALPHLARLYEATGENVHLGVLDGASPETSTVLFVGRVTGLNSIPVVSRAGGRGPLHTTGVGKALLSTRDESWLRRYLRTPREPETQHSVIAEEALRADIDRARARGFATTREEMTLGNVSVAAALPRVEGLPPVAIGLVVHLDRADERRLGPLVVQTARDLHAALRDAR